MKIGILTLTLHTNYGGILQAYALQTVLERMGHEVEVFNRPFIPSKTKWLQIPKRIIKRLLGRDVVIFSERKYNREAPVINKAVWDFRKKYIHERIINSLHEIKEDDYDCIVVGSDQVWRPRYFKSQWNTGIEDAFLAFTKGWNIKRIAYAASFGVDIWEYTKEETIKCREAIQLFDAVSVREKSGVNLVKEYLNASANNVIDPTMILGKNDYNTLIKSASTHKSDGVLLIYFLNVNKRIKALVKRIEKEKGIKSFSVNCTFIKKTSPIDERIMPSIETWLRGFDDAKYVLTDSFHACVFSIIFAKPFIIVNNTSRGLSRIESLLRMFNDNVKPIDFNDFNKTFFINPSEIQLTNYIKSSQVFLARSIVEIDS